MSVTKAKRLGRVQFFGRTTNKEDNRYAGTQLGIVTYDNDENYHVSYLEVGVRCDHFVEPIIRRGPTGGTRTNASNPLEYDADLIRPKTVSVPADSQSDSSDKQEVPA